MTFRQKMTSRLFAGASVVGCVFVIYLIVGRDASANSGVENVDEDSSRAMPVVTRTAKSIEHFTRQREFTGSIKAGRESMLSFERAGRIVEIHVEEGDEVRPGQLLGTIDVEQVVAQREATVAQLEQANAMLAELVSGPRKEAIAATQSRLASLIADAKRLKANYDRSVQLIDKSAISKERLDEAKYAFEFAESRRDAIREELNELLAGTRTERISAQRAEVKRLEAEIARLDLDVIDGQLTAPYAGRIARRLLDEGTVVSGGEPVLQIMENGRLEAWFGIPPESAGRLKNGDEFPATVGSDTVRMTLASLRPCVDATTKTQNVVFDIVAAPEHVVPGQIVRIALDEVVRTNGYEVPSTSLVPGPRGLWNVLVVGRDERVEQRSVELLYSLGEQSIVGGTVKSGDEILIDGVHRVVTGQRVTPVSRSTDFEE